MIKSGLAITSASSLSTRACIPLGPMDLCPLSPLRFSRTTPSSARVEISTSQTLSPHSRVQESRVGVPEAKTEAKKAFSISVFLASPVTRTHPLFSRGPSLSLVFLLLFTYLEKKNILYLFCKLSISFYNNVTHLVDEGKVVVVIFLDFSKALLPSLTAPFWINCLAVS